MRRSALLNVMVQSARKAARGLIRDFGEVEQLQVSRRGPAEFARAANQRAAEVLHKELLRVRPGFGIVIDDTGDQPGTDPSHRWIVDPLNGRDNFQHGVPQFAISIALEHVGILIAGLILDPVSDDLFLAERGVGAMLNDRRLRVSSRTLMSDSLIGCALSAEDRSDGVEPLAELKRIQGQVSGVRVLGSPALDLAYIASGRLEGYWQHDLPMWGIAAGVMIVRESAGMVTDLSGKDDWSANGSILASNQLLHQQLLDRISNKCQ
jgi:myo-inositol-1(or 4)-monophosphatase